MLEPLTEAKAIVLLTDQLADAHRDLTAARLRIAELEARVAEIAKAYDVTFKRRTELELAILPFVEFAAHAVDVERGVWATGVHRDPLSTWLGPSDFAAVAKLKA